MNNIFQTNILALKTKNPALAAILETFIPNTVPQLVQENGSYNIIYKDQYIHNRKNPLGEAAEIFSMAKNEPVSIHVIYGLGLGYLFQLASVKSKGTVILYEPDLNILWLAFTLVDFSNDILKKNIFVTSELDEVSEVIYKNSGIKNSPEMLSLPSQRVLDTNGFEELVKKLQSIVASYSLDLKYTKQKFYPSLKMLLGNIPNIMEEIPLAKFKDAYKGKTALIVSAGPTLDRDIEIIKKYRNNVVIFTVGTALKTLARNGITPDFLCIIETYDSSKQVYGVDVSKINFVTEPYSNPAVRKFNFKNRFSHISANTPINHFWSEICGENIEEYWSKGTVSYTALNCARILGCSKIILSGQDLAYIDGQCYSKDSAYKDLVCGINPETGKPEIMAKDFEKFSQAISNSPDSETREKAAKTRLRNLNASLYFVKGINGNMLPTESVYSAFINPLTEYTQHFNDRIYINTSLVGAQIDGFKNLPLEEALKDSEPTGDLTLKTDFQYNKDLIYSNLTDKLNELKKALNIIEEGKRLAKSLNNDLKRYRGATVEVLKSLKKLSLNYITLASDFTNESKLFDYITIADRINLDYEMKMTQNFTAENITGICEKIMRYYTNAEKRILEIESINTKG